MKITLSKGPAMFLISSFLFAVMGVFVKLASPYTTANEIALVRFLIGIIFALILAATGYVTIASSNKILLVARGVFGGLAVILFFAAIKSGTLTNATVLNNTYPIFALIWAAFYLKEKIRAAVVLPMTISIVGIVMLTHPNISAINSGDLLALASAFLAGISIVIIRKLRQTESAWSVFFYLSIFGAVFSGIAGLPVLNVPAPPGIIYILIAGFLGMAGQVFMTAGYKYCTASVGSILSMSTAVFSGLFGFMFLGERLSVLELVGASLIVISCAYLAYFSNVKDDAAANGELSDISGSN